MKRGFVHRPVAFVLAASDHGTMIVNRNDQRMQTPTAGIGVGFQILSRSSFDPDEVGLALDILHERRRDFGDGVVAIDCGANIGVHTIEWARAMHGWGEVLAVEAQERLFYALAGNIAINNCFNARALHAAIGAVDGMIRVPVPDYTMPGSFGSLEIRRREATEFIGQAVDYAAGAGAPTRLVAIDSLDLPRCDFIKLDVEGMEVEALDGAARTLARCRPSILAETIKSDQTALGERLARHGYRLRRIGINVLAVHESDPLLGRLRSG